MVRFGTVAKVQSVYNSVAIAPARLGDLQISGIAKVGNDFTDASLGHAHLRGQVGQFHVWLLANLHDHMAVVAQKCPTHTQTIAEV